MSLGKTLVVAGIVLAAIGLVVQLAPALRLGRLPGDLSFGGSNWRVYVPLGTSVLLSLVLTLVFSFIGALTRR